MKGTLSDRATRHSRCQWASYREHHDGYHENGLFTDPPLAVAERFHYVGLMVTLYLPHEAVGFQEVGLGLEPRIVDLSARDRTLMWERGDIRVEKDFVANRFLGAYAIELGLPALHTSSDKTLRENFRQDPEQYTMPFMSRLVELAADVTGLGVDYVGARDEGLLPPGVPPTAGLFLLGRVQAYEDAYRAKPVESQESITSMLQRATSLELPIAV